MTTLTAEQTDIKRMIAEFAKGELAARAFEPETEEEYWERLRKLAAQGLLGLTAPPEYGGGGLSYFDALLAVEEMAKYDPRSAGEMHTNGTGTASHLWVLGTHEQKERWLRPICEGRLRCAIAMTEPEAGSEATAMKTTAIDDGDAYVLNGGKIFISGGHHADIFVTYARFGEGEGGKNIGALIVEKDTPGFSILRNDRNMAGELQAQLLFDDCRVPKENVLVTGNAFGRLIRIYNRNRLSGVAQALGMAQASYEDALEYSKIRQQFGRELADFQGLQWMLADMAIQLFGGYGYMEESPVNWRYRRVRGMQIYGGTMQIHRNMIAARILGPPNDQRRR